MNDNLIDRIPSSHIYYFQTNANPPSRISSLYDTGVFTDPTLHKQVASSLYSLATSHMTLSEQKKKKGRRGLWKVLCPYINTIPFASYDPYQEELHNVVEIPAFSNGVVVHAAGKLSPDLYFGAGDVVEGFHVGGSSVSC